MFEITLLEFEQNFEEIMNKVEKQNASYFIILPDGNRMMLVPQKNEIMNKMEREGLIEKFK